MEKQLKLPLDGVRVVECGVYIAAPVASAVLADLGAEVIKVEPLTGDLGRGILLSEGADMRLAHGLPYDFEVDNRSKKSIALDLHLDEGRQILYQLVNIADVFLENMRPEAARRAGLDYLSLKRINPCIIYGSCTAFGPKGPRAQDPGIAALIHAYSGIMLALGEPGTDPVNLGGAIADYVAGLNLSIGVLASLLAQRSSGWGQEVQVSLLGSMVWLQSRKISRAIMGNSTHRQARARAINPIYNYYCCQDGKWIFLAHSQARFWPRLCAALGLSYLEADPRFRTAEDRGEHCQELISILDRTFATKTQKEWLRDLSEAGDLLYAPVNDYADVLEDPHVTLNHYITEVNHPTLGKLKEPVFPVHLGGDVRPRWSPAPELGEHTEEILSDLLGWPWEKIVRLKGQAIL